MCGRNINLILSALLFSLLCLAPGLCSAAPETITMTMAEAQQFQDSFERQLQIISDLQLRMRNSNELITSLEKRLQQSNLKAQSLESNSKQAKEMQLQQQKIIAELKSDYKKQETLLNQTLAEFARYVKEHRQRRNNIGIYGNTTSAGVFVMHDRLMISVGQKWTGGLEAGAGVVVVAW